MPICTNCDKEIRDGLKFCTGCGTPVGQAPEKEVEEKACKGCGHLLRPDQNFCVKCGRAYLTEEPPPHAHQAEQAMVSPTAAGTSAAPEVPLSAPRLASPWIRMAAAMMDFLLLFIVALFTRNGASGFFYLVWYTVSESVLKGQTLGMKIFNIQAVNDDFSPATGGQCFVRTIVKPLDIVLLTGILLPLLTERRQRLGDRIAKTVVVEVPKQ